MEPTEKTTLSAFISAGTSPLGRAVTRALVAAGHKVTAMTTNRAGAETIRADGGLPVYAEPHHTGEIKSMMKMAKTDVALHLSPQQFNEVPFVAAAPDANALLAHAEAFIQAAQAAGVKFLAHTSFANLYADTGGEVVDESAPLTHLWHPWFDAAKQVEWRTLEADVPACVLRAGYVYGATTESLSVMEVALKQGRSIPVGHGENFANWIHIDDFARALALVAQKHPDGEIFNLVDDHPVTPAQFLSRFATAQGLPAPGAPRARLFGDKWAETLLKTSIKASNAKIKEALGWMPQYPEYGVGIDHVLLMWRAMMTVKP